MNVALSKVDSRLVITMALCFLVALMEGLDLQAMGGPLIAGKMLALGTGSVGIMAASASGIVIAGIAVFWLLNLNRRNEDTA